MRRGAVLDKARVTFAKKMLARGGVAKLAEGGYPNASSPHLPRTYVPYQGNPFTYGYGPGHRFFQKSVMPLPVPGISADTAVQNLPTPGPDAGAFAGDDHGGTDSRPDSGFEGTGGAGIDSVSDEQKLRDGMMDPAYSRQPDFSWPDRISPWAGLAADLVVPGAGFAGTTYNAARGINQEFKTADLKNQAMGTTPGFFDGLVTGLTGAVKGISGLGASYNPDQDMWEDMISYQHGLTGHGSYADKGLDPGSLGWDNAVAGYNAGAVDPEGLYGGLAFAPGELASPSVERGELGAPSRSGDYTAAGNSQEEFGDSAVDLGNDDDDGPSGNYREAGEDGWSWGSPSDRRSGRDGSEDSDNRGNDVGSGGYDRGGDDDRDSGRRKGGMMRGISRLAFGGTAAGGPPMHGISQMSMPQMFVSGGAATKLSGGQDDDIPAMLSEGEFVIPADVVAKQGDSNPERGAKILWNYVNNVRSHMSTGGQPPKAKGIGEYMKARGK